MAVHVCDYTYREYVWDKKSKMSINSLLTAIIFWKLYAYIISRK